jgi:pimeloyl-ACP methyl ester carboxylesterase
MRSRPLTALLGAVMLVGVALGGLASYTAVETHLAEHDYPAAGQFVTVENVALRYREAGRGSTVVLLHGNPGFLEDFAPDDEQGVFAKLSREFRTVAIDRPGHGYSGRPSGPGTTPPEQARLLHAALKRLAVTRPILVGHSWGGGLALTYALQYPREVAGLVLLGTRAFRDSANADVVYVLNRAPLVGTLLRRTIMLPIGRRILDRRLTAAYAPDAPRAEHVARARALWLRPSQIVATVWDTPNLQQAFDMMSPHYRSIGVPVTILVGDRDRGIGESRRLSQTIPGSTLAIVPNTGHELPLTRADDIVAAVRQVANNARPSVR